MANVVIAHPFEFVSSGMEAILERCGSKVSGVCGEVGQAISAARAAGADVLILSRCLIDDINEPIPSKTLEGDFSGKIVVVLERSDELSAEDFVALDVDGLILDSASSDDLVECIASVRKGRQWIDPHIRNVLETAHQPMADWGGLSGRELEIALLAATGLSNKEIARRLNVAIGTVKIHMHHILTKLHFGSRVDIVWKFPELSSHLAAYRSDRLIA